MRIDWTEDEENRVVKTLKEMLIGDKVPLPMADPFTKSGKGLLKYVRQAQLVLDEGRRRDLHSAGTLRGISPKIVAAGILAEESLSAPVRELSKDELRIQQLGEERDAALAMVDPLEKKIKEQEAELNTLRAAIRAIPKSEDIVKDFIADILRRAKMIAPSVGGISMVEVGKEVTAKHNPNPTSDGVRKPRVAIIGPIPAQQDALSNEFGERLDLRFFQGDERRLGDLLQGFKTSGTVILWTKFASHAQEENIKAAGIPYIRQVEWVKIKEKLQELSGG